MLWFISGKVVKSKGAVKNVQSFFRSLFYFAKQAAWYGALYMKFGERGTVDAPGGGGCKLMLQRRCRLLER
ncbi:hypothetical protein, partial [Dialister succinatiphilus]|uniref:hypothetical protein n=1 Tax=Dialister succinatiphilus TaxID=487173 RepID=UPI003AB9017D